MKKLFAVPFVLLFLAGCQKKSDNNKCGYTDSTIIAPQAQQDALLDSLTAHGIQATLDPAGFYYSITNPGSGAFVSNLCTTIATYYKGSFFNGQSFDSSLVQPAVFQLGQVISGWQKGIPLIKKGGEITLYFPPSLGYGSKVQTDRNGNVAIPANSYLVFDVTLVDLQD